MLKQSYIIPSLPPPVVLETRAVLTALIDAHRNLAEVKGRAASIPNQGILLDTLALQEAKASSEIENIVTTQDDLFSMDASLEDQGSPAGKEVARYREALKHGYRRLGETQGLITGNMLIEMFQILKVRTDEYRTVPGTALRNGASGNLVYVPPQEYSQIVLHMTELEKFMNGEDGSQPDPLIKMAIIHHQFESIHPFADGNGRLGRILNVLYLTKTGLIESPILYLSRHITRTKSDYYRLLQEVRDHGAWEEWIVYMLHAVSETAQITLEIIEGMRKLMSEYKIRMRGELPRLYSQDLLNNFFRHPYTRIEFVQNDLNITRQTASNYLNKLVEHGFVEKFQSGRNNYYINSPLVDLFLKVSGEKRHS